MNVEQFIDRWKAARGGAERANYQMFLTELCEALDLPRPDPASHATTENDYVFEVYADFSGSGRAYSPFPDRKGFRIRLDDLRDPAVVERLRAIWTDPHSLDPSKKAALVTRQIAERLAAVSRRLERNHPPEEVAHFLMRCIFTMFAEVTALPNGTYAARRAA